jgi:hypothetical protein
VPGARCRVLKPGTQDLIFETGQRYLSKMEIKKVDSNIFDTYLFPVSNIKSQVPGFRTRHPAPALGVQGLALGTWDKNLRRSKNLIYTFLIDIFVQSQISSPEFWVSGLGTWHSGFRVWHSEISHLYF